MLRFKKQPSVISVLILVPFLFSCRHNNTLRANETLEIDQVLVSDNRKYKLVMQKDGNLVLYKGMNEPIWSTNTEGKPVKRCVLQEDGNLVLYDNAFNAYWATSRFGQNGVLILQNDANLVVYANNSHIWDSGSYITK